MNNNTNDESFGNENACWPPC